MLKQLIDHLQEMLAAIQAQISAAAARSGHGDTQDPALGSLQAEASAIQGQISAAAAKMAEMLLANGQSSGTLINDQA
jgi:capsule polysaccharide export protein KpsE/RkpR